MPYCSACGNTLPVGAKVCANCGVPLVALVVPPPKRTLLKILLFVVVAFIFLAVLGDIGHRNVTLNPSRSVSSKVDLQNSAGNDAEEMLARCGTPFKDDSTAYDSPRPPIVTRFIEYKVRGMHLRFIYVPNNGHAGDPPPYNWKLQMVANVRTNRLLSRSQVSGIMPCWLGG